MHDNNTTHSIIYAHAEDYFVSPNVGILTEKKHKFGE